MEKKRIGENGGDRGQNLRKYKTMGWLEIYLPTSHTKRSIEEQHNYCWSFKIM